jgi:hypothetical protein
MAAEGLDFGTPVESATVKVVSPALAGGLAAGAVILFVLTAALTGWFFARRCRPWAGRASFRLATLPAPLPLVVLMLVIGMMVVQGFAVADVYVQTQVVQPSAHEYFQTLSTARLFGMSHAHVFGFFMMYGTLAALAAGTRLPAQVTCFLAAVPLWGGLFDVLSWWGFKFIGPQFEWLAMTTGSASATVSLIFVAAVVRDVLAPIPEKS